MQISKNCKPYNRVDYFPLPNGYADVFLHQNEIMEQDEESNTVYVVDEVYFQVKQTTTKEQIEANFDVMWNGGWVAIPEPTDSERISQLETLVLQLSGVI